VTHFEQHSCQFNVQKCYQYYTSGEIRLGEDGVDEQCRWCGEGGKLIGCDDCSNAFCKHCIKKNLGRNELAAVTSNGRCCLQICVLVLMKHIEVYMLVNLLFRNVTSTTQVVRFVCKKITSCPLPLPSSFLLSAHHDAISVRCLNCSTICLRKQVGLQLTTENSR
jgi:hypothetical protein